MQTENVKKKEIIDVYDGGMSQHMFRHDEIVEKEQPSQEKYDMVHNPKHYRGKSGKLQAIHVIEEFELNYNLGNVCKYLLRANRKHEESREDLLKILWYCSREIKNQGYEKDLKDFYEKQLKDMK